MAEAVDRIIYDGTELYSTHIAERRLADSKFQKNVAFPYLLINELPATFSLRGNMYSLTRLDPIYIGRLGTATSQTTTLTYSLKDAITEVFSISDSCLMTLGPSSCGYTSALHQDDNKFMCFDSHSRSTEGVRSFTGKAVIIETTSLTSLISYITDLATSLFNSMSLSETPFEFVPVVCERLTITDDGKLGKPNYEFLCEMVSFSSFHYIYLSYILFVN
jgi:hypothetical protein